MASSVGLPQGTCTCRRQLVPVLPLQTVMVAAAQITTLDPPILAAPLMTLGAVDPHIKEAIPVVLGPALDHPIKAAAPLEALISQGPIMV